MSFLQQGYLIKGGLIMNKYLRIKKLYPDILDSDFMLQNDSDDRGAYIKKWTYAQPQPTQAELEAMYPQVLKEQKLVELKAVYKQVLYKNHDIDDKIEALAGLKTAQEILEIKNWIKAVQYVFGQVKTRINAGEVVDVSYNAILSQVEAYYMTL